jgi:hypothetical protein
VTRAHVIAWRDDLVRRFVLLPNTSDTMFLTVIARFRDSVARMIGNGKLARWIAARWLRAFVYSDGGVLFKVEITSSVRKVIRAVAAAPLGASAPT